MKSEITSNRSELHLPIKLAIDMLLQRRIERLFLEDIEDILQTIEWTIEDDIFNITEHPFLFLADNGIARW